MNGYRTFFPPLLITIPEHQTLLREVAAAVDGARAVRGLEPEYWRTYRDEGQRLASQIRDADLRAAWDRVGVLHQSFVDAADSALSAAGAGDSATARDRLDAAFEASRALLELLVGASLRELSLAIAAREERLLEHYEQDFLDAAQVGRFTVRVLDHVLTDADENFLQMMDLSIDEAAGADLLRFIDHGDFDLLVELARQGSKAGRVIVTATDSAGRPITLSLAGFLERKGRREFLRCFAVNTGGDEEDAQRRSLLARAIEFSEELVIITNARHEIVYVNPAFSRLTGYPPEEALGRNPRFLQGRDTDAESRREIRQGLGDGRQVHAEVVNYTRAGEPYWVEMSIVPVTNRRGDVTHWIAIERDVSQRKQSEQAITRLAMEDHLTGLPNRRAADERLVVEWNRARRGGESFAVALVDLDRFKLVNDQYGHHVGDQTLRHVADVMDGNLRRGDWMARWGGEEFLVCFHQLDERGAAVAGERIRKLVKSRPLKLALGSLPLSVSIGVCLYSPEHENLDSMLALADSLLYEAKQSGRDRVLCSSGAEQRRSGVIWEGSLVQAALHEGRIVPAYQPIVDLRTGNMVAEEALARIVERDHELIPAQRFIQAAEALHLVAQVDRRVSEHAVRYLLGRLREDPALATRDHFVNLSPQFLADREGVANFLEHVRSLTRLETARNPVVIEITERQTGDMGKLRKHLQPLLDAGCRLALDDFGSGYSSFMYLAELPVNFLKIEGWMVQRINRDRRVRQLVETLVNTAQKLKVTSVAECVEDSATAQVLCDIGVDWAQGYYFGMPAVEKRDE